MRPLSSGVRSPAILPERESPRCRAPAPWTAARAPRRRRGLRPGAEAGQETLQAVLVVAFVLLPVLVSILTFGALVHVYIGAQAAAAGGARAAGAAGGFGAEQAARVDDELRANGIDPTRCRVAASSAVVALDEPISVTVACPQHIGIPFLLERDVTLTSTYATRGEVDR